MAGQSDEVTIAPAARKSAARKPAPPNGKAEAAKQPQSAPAAAAVMPPKADPVKPKAVSPAKTAKAGKAEKPGKTAKAAKVDKARKPKMKRDSFAIPEEEYALFAVMKKRLLDQKMAVRKSEILRAGLALLATQADVELVALIQKLTPIKTGRPAK